MPSKTIAQKRMDAIENKIDRLADAILGNQLVSPDVQVSTPNQTITPDSTGGGLGNLTTEDGEVIPEENIDVKATGSYVPPSYKDAVERILGKDFGFEVNMVEDQDMAEVTVPGHYRDKRVIQAYISHWKSRRTLYENSIPKNYPTMSQEQREVKMAEYDAKNSEPNIPSDKRSRAISTLKTIIEFRKWLLLIRDNVKKELSVVKEESEIPSDSLQEELGK